jgi:hypothetical protein
LPYCRIVNPVSPLHVQAEKIRMNSFPDGDEMRHDRDPNLSTKKTYDMKESGESECRLWFR